VATASSVAGRAPAAALIDAHDPVWGRFVEAHPDRLPIHDPAWLRVLAGAYGFRPFVISITDGAGGIEAGIPLMEVHDAIRGRRWIALPFTDCCPPLCARPAAARHLADAVARAAEDDGVSSVEVRAPLTDWTATAVATAHDLDLSPGLATLQRGFTASTRRNVRKAQREQLVVRRAEREDDLVEVYYGLHLRTRRRLGVPMQPRRFFRSLWRNVLDTGRGELLLVSSNGVPVAGAVFLRAGGTVMYKYAASDERAWALRPNNVLIAEAIRRAAEEGYRRFDFGRSDFADAGLRSFKIGWGAAERPLVYSCLGDAAASTGVRGGRLLGKVIRRSPTAVCRIIGECLYRYAA
jgi:CelD/BcsL family acetyltransferase involved in cellulose biosynthesis